LTIWWLLVAEVEAAQLGPLEVLLAVAVVVASIYTKPVKVFLLQHLIALQLEVEELRLATLLQQVKVRIVNLTVQP
jgi:hypothetical protein|tara:strand:- start:693 stop:920 length:228 start_codon:yes stop_codon:yes gene_type:complete